MLEEGKIYRFKRKIKEGTKPKIVRKSMRLVKKYGYHALFESMIGIRECFTYWQIGKLLSGEGLEDD